MPPQITVSDLESVLSEIEPIFRATDSTFQFTHPSFQEVLTAKQFADEINSGDLSVRDAYERFWSYEENLEVWRLDPQFEWRSFLLAWSNMILMMAPFLLVSKSEEIIDASLESFNRLGEKKGKPYIYDTYNPFIDDLYLICAFASKSKAPEIKKDYLVKLILSYLPNEFPLKEKPKYTYMRSVHIPSIHIHLLTALANIGTDRAVRELEQFLKYDLWYTRGFDDDVGPFSELILPLIKSTNIKRGNQIIEEKLGNLGRFETFCKNCKYPNTPFLFGGGSHWNIQDRKGLVEAFKYYWPPRGFYYGKVRELHLLLKPEGYNPSIKRLVV